MTTVLSPARRLLLAGGLAAAFVAAPLLAMLPGPADPAGPLASCPTGQILDPASGACKPNTGPAATTSQSPIDPEKVPLQPNELTSSRQGDIGSLPEVSGIPCSGAHSGGSGTGECIGLSENQNQYQAPHASVNGQSVAPGN